VDLTPTQLRILKHILGNTGRIVTLDEFKQNVFQSSECEISSKMRVHIHELRRKLGTAGHLIETVRGKGYGVGLNTA
jgi:DNA-binding winged helix-turn-helix (wHTH) protein